MAVVPLVCVGSLPLALLQAAPAGAEVPLGYQMVDLFAGQTGTPTGEGRDIAADGTVVGGRTSAPTTAVAADGSGVLTYGTGMATAVGGDWVVGTEVVSGRTTSFRWHTTMGIAAPTVVNATGDTVLVDVNASGTAVGWATQTPGGSPVPVVSTAEGPQVLFPAQPTLAGRATAINASGQVVGYTLTASGAAVPFIATVGQSAPTGISGLAGLADARPTAISDTGHVVGTYERPGDMVGTVTVGFRLHTGTGELETGTGLFGAPLAPTDVNSAGDVVAGGPIGAYLWTAEGEIVYLADVIVDDDAATLRAATGINDAGQISGTAALHGGGFRPVRLDPVSTIADLSTTLVASQDAVVQGRRVTHTLRVANTGTGTAHGASTEVYLLEDQAGTDLVVRSLPAACTGQQNGGVGYRIVCQHGDLAPASSVTLAIVTTYSELGAHDASARTSAVSPEVDGEDQHATEEVLVRRRGPVLDLDGDGDTDIAVFRPSNGRWHVQGTTIPLAVAFGTTGDIPVPADYDGDGVTDRAVFRPASGAWYLDVARSPRISWGLSGDVPVPADYDGDGDADVAVFRPSNGRWYVQDELRPVALGAAGDVPVPADYDGDGDAEAAVYRPSTGRWYVAGQLGSTAWGASGDVPVPGDHDGDGDADIAVFRPSTGTWYVQGATGVRFGVQGDVPVPGTYDGDGSIDPAVFRKGSGTWFVAANQRGIGFGNATDIPVALPYAVRRAVGLSH